MKEINVIHKLDGDWKGLTDWLRLNTTLTISTFDDTKDRQGIIVCLYIKGVKITEERIYAQSN